MKSFKREITYKSGEVIRLAIFSDLHADDDGCNFRQLHADLKKEVKKGSLLFFNGDLFSAIIMQDRKRSTASRTLNQDNQLNSYINKVYNVLKDYVNNIEYIGYGNHEESIIKYCGVDILEILIDKLDAIKTNGKIKRGAYQNYYRITFKYASNPKATMNYDIRFNHGQGGSAPVTKGMIGLTRTQVRANCDLIIEGHSHNALIDYGCDRDELNNKGEIVIKRMASMVIPSYLKQMSVTKEPYHTLNWAESAFRGISAGNGYGVIELKPTATAAARYIKRRLYIEMEWNSQNED